MMLGMRVTVTLDEDVRRILEDAMRRRGIWFKQALNDAVRASLLRAGARRCSLGAEQLFPWDKALAAADAIEDQELLGKP